MSDCALATHDLIFALAERAVYSHRREFVSLLSTAQSGGTFNYELGFLKVGIVRHYWRHGTGPKYASFLTGIVLVDSQRLKPEDRDSTDYTVVAHLRMDLEAEGAKYESLRVTAVQDERQREALATGTKPGRFSAEGLRSSRNLLSFKESWSRRLQDLRNQNRFRVLSTRFGENVGWFQFHTGRLRKALRSCGRDLTCQWVSMEPSEAVGLDQGENFGDRLRNFLFPSAAMGN
jgi:hypothetical protein